MHEITTEYCKKCFFHGYLGGSHCCDRYLKLGEGYRRNCPEGLCDKFLKKNPTDEEIIENMELNMHVDNPKLPSRVDPYRDYHF